MIQRSILCSMRSNRNVWTRPLRSHQMSRFQATTISRHQEIFPVSHGSFSTSTASSTTTTTTTSTPSIYHIEVSNMARHGVTQVIVTGPGTLGLLASLCVTLATHGGSIKELLAADALGEQGLPHDDKAPEIIRDVIAVVDYTTGKAFRDDQLPELAQALLQSTRAPAQVVAAVQTQIQEISQQHSDAPRGEITVLPLDRFKKQL